MANEVDIIENNLLADFGQEVFDILLTDHSVTEYKKDGKTHHIFWATHDYEQLGEGYSYFDEIAREKITGEHSDVIMPRVLKEKAVQKKRVKKKAEIFTPAWICNYMVNNIDENYFGRRIVFNEELGKEGREWRTVPEKVTFPEGKTWRDYVSMTWEEITCGEAPFMVSRYDTTTGVAIPLKDRIGFLDRKFRIVNENTDTIEEWFKYVIIAYKCVRAYEWQGDSLFLARENLFYTFIDNYEYKFGTRPSVEQIKEVADIISWNVFQMDGLKCVVPNTCHDVETRNLYGEIERTPCPGCKKKRTYGHNGIPALLRGREDGKYYPYEILYTKGKVK